MAPKFIGIPSLIPSSEPFISPRLGSGRLESGPAIPCNTSKLDLFDIFGEGLYDEFYRWFSRLNDQDAAAYAESNPEPEEWRGHYARIRAHSWK